MVSILDKETEKTLSNSVTRSGEFSPFWLLLRANGEKNNWGIPHQKMGNFALSRLCTKFYSK